jgi:zinc transport system substrate-binding protein
MRVLGLAISTLLLCSNLATADVKVMASIKPIHSLVANVMEGIGVPGLIVDGSNSPHTYTLKPSDAAALEQTDVVFYVGHELETFLEKPLESLGQNARRVSLIDAPGIKTLPVREDANFEAHHHAGEEHTEGVESDPHIWLDPDNAKAMVKTIANTLSVTDAVHAAAYNTNAEKTLAKLDTLSRDIQSNIAPARNQGFIVFHDAYQYFESRFGLKANGAISVHPENPPGAKQINDIKSRIKNGSIKCVFSEPQFDSKLISVVIEGTEAKTATLDPIGATLEPGPSLYIELIQNIASGLESCLTAE